MILTKEQREQLRQVIEAVLDDVDELEAKCAELEALLNSRDVHPVRLAELKDLRIKYSALQLRCNALEYAAETHRNLAAARLKTLQWQAEMLERAEGFVDIYAVTGYALEYREKAERLLADLKKGATNE